MSQCPAIIRHGPGHQSKTHCQKLIPHKQHYAEIRSENYYWSADEVCSGFFDESPEEEDELEPVYQPTFVWLHRALGELDKQAHNYGKIDWRLGVLGAFIELAEAMQELPWRPWRVSDHRGSTPEERTKACDEFADAICTIVRACGQLNITGSELQEAVIRHVIRKQERLSSGVDH